MGNFFHSKAFAILVVITLIVVIPLTIYSVQQQQEIRQRAQENVNLVCSPFGGMDKKYNSNTLTVTNNKTTSVPIWIQENLCPYQGTAPTEGYQCNTYSNRYNDTLQPSQTKNYSITVPDCTIGQIDVNTINNPDGGCYTPTQQLWTGGLAFSVSVNSQNCGVPTPTPTPTVTPVPTATPIPTGTPTPIPTATPLPTNTPTPVLIVVQPTATPIPALATTTPTIAPQPTVAPTGDSKTNIIYGTTGVILTILGALIFFAL